MSEPSLPELMAERDRLFAQLGMVGDFRRGSVSENWRRCGKPNCACAAPEHPGHGPRFLWTRSAGRRKTVARQLAAGEVEKVRREIARHAEFATTVEQIIEVNEKDVRDILQLLSAFPVSGDSPGEQGPVVDRARFCKILRGDWGWWRTVTSNLNKLPLLVGEHPDLLPALAPHDALRNAERLIDLADATPKSMQWKIRSKVGDRVRWYELPEEVAH